MGTVEYLRNHQLALSEIRRVMKTGGTLSFQTIFKVKSDDRYRRNVHTRKYWIAELSDYGFRLLPTETRNWWNREISDWIIHADGGGIKMQLLKIARGFPALGPYLLSKYISLGIGTLLFKRI